MSRPRIAIAGAGVIGLSVGLALLKRGAAVDLHDDFVHPPASAVAAGMLAPAFESVLDPKGGDYALLSAAAGYWPAFLERVGAEDALARSGALFASADEARLHGLLEALKGAGAKAELVGPAQAKTLQPGLSDGLAGAVYAAEESRLDAEPLLERLKGAFAASGGRVLASRLAHAPAAVDALVVAAGYEAAALAASAPELGVLQPIKGQLLAFPGQGPLQGPMVRGDGIYVAPQPGGAVAGATMELGRADLQLDAAVLASLQEKAGALFPSLAAARAVGRSGVRAATPDGLPLAGPSNRPGVFLAAGARRNGWLLAPLVAEVVAAAIFGEAGPAEANLFDPRRYA
jgi:glycine oxidase